MLLVIPSIEIKEGKCARMVQSTNGKLCTDDPVEMAKLWRIENFKILHVTDIDGAVAGYVVNFEVVRKMVKTVDIPIELGGGLRSLSDVKKAFDVGIFRVVIGSIVIENPDEAKRILDVYGPNKIVLGINVKEGVVKTKGWTYDSGLTIITVALNAKQLGFRRIIYRDIVVEDGEQKLNHDAVKMLAEKTGLKVTVSGGISGLKDLMRLQELESLGVDSVIIGRALYENKFSCQGLWRLCETDNYPFTAKV